MVVCKFGGSSLSTAEGFKRVKEIILSSPARTAVVVSAPGKRFSADEKVTDILYNADYCVKHGGNYKKELDKAVKRLDEIRSDLKLATDVFTIFDEAVEEYLNGLDTDYLVSRGEYITALMMAEYLGFGFIDARDAVVFDYNGKVNMQSSRARLTAEFSKAKSAVIPGFYGGYPNGGIRTFTRGGGDVSGAVVANLLSAQRYENWTDVSGVRLADPSVVDGAAGVKRLTYGGLKRLSSLGAKILHGETVAYIEECKIPIDIKNTFDPFGEFSTVLPDGEEQDKMLGLAGKRGFFNFSLKISAGGLTGMTEILKHMAVCAVRVKYIASGEGNISLLAECDKAQADATLMGLANLSGVEGASATEACVVGGVFASEGLAFLAQAQICDRIGGLGVKWITAQGETLLVCADGEYVFELIRRVYDALR